MLGGALRQTARAWPKAAWRAVRSARPAPSAALVSRALVCGACAGVRLRSPFGSALARSQSRGQSVNRQSAHRLALDRRAARGDHTLRASPTGKSPDRLCLPTPARGARLRPLLWGRRMAGAERSGPKRFKRPRARRIAQSGWPLRPPASAGRFFLFFLPDLLSSFLLSLLAIALLFFPHFFLRNALKPENKTRPAALCAPLFVFGVSTVRRPDPGKQKKAERSAGNAPLGANSIGSARPGHSARGFGVTANRACRCAIAFSRSFGPLPTAEFADAGCFASPRWPWPRRS